LGGGGGGGESRGEGGDGFEVRRRSGWRRGELKEVEEEKEILEEEEKIV
jgi:hypothetical protein